MEVDNTFLNMSVGSSWAFGFLGVFEKCWPDISKKKVEGLLVQLRQKGGLLRAEIGVEHVAIFETPEIRFSTFINKAKTLIH